MSNASSSLLWHGISDDSNTTLTHVKSLSILHSWPRGHGRKFPPGWPLQEAPFSTLPSNFGSLFFDSFDFSFASFSSSFFASFSASSFSSFSRSYRRTKPKTLKFGEHLTDVAAQHAITKHKTKLTRRLLADPSTVSRVRKSKTIVIMACFIMLAFVVLLLLMYVFINMLFV